ncbi:MAG: homoserine kinase [Candidatus Bathyarchaeia archaeon]
MSIRVRSPASTANLGPGYDVLGLALDVGFDTVELELTREKGVTIEVDGIDAHLIPTNPESNTAGLVASRILDLYARDVGVEIRLTKGVPIGVGLGSSGASAAATTLSLSHLLKLNLAKNRLVELAAMGEVASAGEAHADNVSPSLLGGFTIVRSYRPLDVLSFPPPELTFSIAVPTELKKTTRDARAILPKTVDLRDMVQNLGSLSLVVSGALLSNPELFGRGMLGDTVVEPARAPLYPGYRRVREAALEAGAEGVALSGAGPTMIAVVDPEKAEPRAVATAMGEAFEDAGVHCQTHVTKPTSGASLC